MEHRSGAAVKSTVAVVVIVGLAWLAPSTAFGAGGLTMTGCTTALDYADAVTVSPDGANVYVAAGPDGGGGGQIDEFGVSSSGPAPTPPTPTPTPAPPPPPPPAQPSTTTITATIRNQRLTLTTPSRSACTMPAARLSVTLDSAAISSPAGFTLKLERAAFYLDRGVRHTRRIHHGTHTVAVVGFAANATVRHLPAALALPVAALKPGLHTLTVRVSYRERERRQHREVTTTIVKTLTAKVTVC